MPCRSRRTRRPAAPRNLIDVKQTLLAQARQQRGQGAALSQQDNDVFELLHMLYGQIESEIRPEAPATALIRRLQLPLLRVALQDRAFFVRAQHPARQLLNTVAEHAAKWLDADDFDPQLLLPLQQAVSHVVEKYDGDTPCSRPATSSCRRTCRRRCARPRCWSAGTSRPRAARKSSRSPSCAPPRR